MSATNRAPGRISGDFYGTPRLYILAVLPELMRHVPEGIRVGPIHDPCSGDGAILSALMAAGCPRESLSGNEIDPVLRMFCAMETGIVPTLGDYLNGPPPPPHGGPGLIVTNPPYSLALGFAERATAHVSPPGGIVALFLRLGFAASLERSEFHARNPARILICNPRPSFARFVKGGKTTTTDASEYAWFIYGLPPHLAGTWAHLDCRPAAVAARLAGAGFPVPEDMNGPPPPTIRDGAPPPWQEST